MISFLKLTIKKTENKMLETRERRFRKCLRGRKRQKDAINWKLSRRKYIKNIFLCKITNYVSYPKQGVFRNGKKDRFLPKKDFIVRGRTSKLIQQRLDFWEWKVLMTTYQRKDHFPQYQKFLWKKTIRRQFTIGIK